jgi:anti-anti-sigma regulatory factor
MLTLHMENIGEMAVIECEGGMLDREAAEKLREAVNRQLKARIIVLDLSEVPAIQGDSVAMLVFLQKWVCDHDIRLKLFNPRQSVRARLERVNSMQRFDIPTLDEMMALLIGAEHHSARAA